jgi:hypothetical protein
MTGTQYKLLAEAMPARSFAAAANKLDELEQREYENFDMMGLKNQRQWPDERLNEARGSDWWHSDFRAIALLYTHPMWKKMIDMGALNK